MFLLQKLAVAAALLAQCASSHLYMAYPPSRQFWQTTAYQTTPTEYCPHCYNFRGVSATQERGGGGPWPHLNLYEEGKLNPVNGNYMETVETAGRHTSPCGDPSQTAGSDSDNKYGLANSNYPVLTEFSQSSEFQVKVVVSTYHWGHIELNLCDATGMEDAEVTHECLSQHPLTRARAELEPPIDPLHPGRYFLDPPCRAAETDQSFESELGGAQTGDIVTMTFMLPENLVCERCVLQMMYYVSNSCVHPGYAEFESEEWPAGCAPTKADWISSGMSVCGTPGGNYVEEFASCSDISIISNGGGGGDDVGTDDDIGADTVTTEPSSDTPDDTICNCTCTQSCVDVWMQCGGDENWSKTENCCEGATCVAYNNSYAQCVPN